MWYGPDKNYPDMNEVFKIKTQKPIEGGKIGLYNSKILFLFSVKYLGSIHKHINDA